MAAKNAYITLPLSYHSTPVGYFYVFEKTKQHLIAISSMPCMTPLVSWGLDRCLPTLACALHSLPYRLSMPLSNFSLFLSSFTHYRHSLFSVARLSRARVMRPRLDLQILTMESQLIWL